MVASRRALTNPPPVGTVLDAAAVLRLRSPETPLNPVPGFHKQRMVDQTGVGPLALPKASRRAPTTGIASWNLLANWLEIVDGLQRAA